MPREQLTQADKLEFMCREQNYGNCGVKEAILLANFRLSKMAVKKCVGQ